MARATLAKAGLVEVGWAGPAAGLAAVAAAVVAAVQTPSSAAGCSVGEKACSGKAKPKASAGLLDLS